MIIINKLKVKDYKCSKKGDIVSLTKGTRKLELYYYNNLFYIEDSLLHQSDVYIFDLEINFYKKVEELC